MIVFGTAVSDRDVYERVALPGIRRAAESDALIWDYEGYDSLQRPCNEMLDAARELDGLEALVLLHQDLELTDGSLPPRVRALLADRRVGVVGSFGARAVPLHRWTESTDLYGVASVTGGERRFGPTPADVEVVDGSLLVLAPWVVDAVRFDESLAADFHGYDVDLCRRVLALGGRVVCDDIPYRHQMSPRDDRQAVRRAGVRLAERWDPALRPGAWEGAFGG
ncbi:MAG: hypothetical protein GXY03_13780 [Solirubrobacterales bacterium]|nr:hypothetical protein [Solirubrobacterales bacterium]